jgi:hypothetical protein
MRRLVTLLCIAAAVVTASGAVSVLPAGAQGTAYSFNLITANTATAESGPFAGDTIRLDGAGTFDTGSRAIVATGKFTHTKADGTVFARGTWRADGFVSFEPFGGPNAGTQGGVLSFTATVTHNGAVVFTGLPMSVTCLVNAPSGFTEEEGTTFGPFTEKTGGMTLFHLG